MRETQEQVTSAILPEYSVHPSTIYDAGFERVHRVVRAVEGLKCPDLSRPLDLVSSLSMFVHDLRIAAVYG